MAEWARRFSLVTAKSQDTVQGFLEWSELGIYGRVAESQQIGDRYILSLGNGGMNGTAILVSPHGSAIDVEYAPDTPYTAKVQSTKPTGGLENRITANFIDNVHALVLIGLQLKNDEKDRPHIAIQLQYLSAQQPREAKMLDNLLRQGNTPYMMAAIRKKQSADQIDQLLQEQAQLQQQNSSASLPAMPWAYIFEEIQYPVLFHCNLWAWQRSSIPS